MTTKEQFLSKRKRYQPISLPQEFSDEEMVKDWTLSVSDKAEVGQYRPNYQLFVVIQLCAVRLYGRFLSDVHHLSPRIVNYLAQQLDLPPSLTIEVPERKATYSQYRKNILTYLGCAQTQCKPVGRPKGSGKSKLDKDRTEIERLLNEGSTQKYIASRFNTSATNLSRWMKKHGLKRTSG